MIVSEKEEHLFQQSNSSWICKKLIYNDEEKVRDHCHINGKLRGAAHPNCTINFEVTKKMPVIKVIIPMSIWTVSKDLMKKITR